MVSLDITGFDGQKFLNICWRYPSCNMKITLKNWSRCGMTCMHPAMVCGTLAMPGIRASTGAIIGAGSIV